MSKEDKLFYVVEDNLTLTFDPRPTKKTVKEYIFKNPDTIVISRKALEGDKKNRKSNHKDEEIFNAGQDFTIDKILNGEIG